MILMLRRVLKEVKEYKAASVATPIFMIGEVLMETLIPFLMASIIDDGVEKGDMHHIYMVGICMVLLAALGSDLQPEWREEDSVRKHPQDLQKI